MIKIKSIDLWNDHKPSQSIDPFIVDYFDEKNLSLSYDKVIICPNLIGNYQVINPEIGELDSSICPAFNGGIIFMKAGKPIRLYFCQSNEIVEQAIGHIYGKEDIFATLESDQKIAHTGLTLLQLLKKNKVEIVVDKNIRSKFTSPNGYVAKNDVVLESADCMGILTGPTFLNSVENWEAITYNQDLVFNVGVIADEFEIEIKHKGYLVGVKQNIGGLVDDVKGKKLYGIALQIGNEAEYKKMVEYAEQFSAKVGNRVTQETMKIGKDIDKALLDIDRSL